MAKSIILYNLKEGVADADYQKWCNDYKGPFFLGLSACKGYNLVQMLGGVKGDGAKGLPPEPTQPPFKYIGIVDIADLAEWQKNTESKPFREEFFLQWFSNWVADFHVLVGEDFYQGTNN